MKNDRQTNSIAELIRLRDQGEITLEEFNHLKQRTIYGDRESSADSTAAPSESVTPWQALPGLTLPIIALMIAGLIYADHVNGSIFPDNWYCAVGAGSSLQQAGRSEAMSWSANNGCNASRPECATQFRYSPASSRCLHGTLWEAIRAKTYGIFAGRPS